MIFVFGMYVTMSKENSPEQKVTIYAMTFVFFFDSKQTSIYCTIYWNIPRVSYISEQRVATTGTTLASLIFDRNQFRHQLIYAFHFFTFFIQNYFLYSEIL